MTALTAERVRAAHADAWQVLGVRGTAEVPGARLMATGLTHPQWNGAAIHDPTRVDIVAVRNWYDDIGVPWGATVPLGASWPHGRHILTQRLMGLLPDAFVPAAVPAGVTLRVAEQRDFDDYLRVDCVAFDESPDLQRPWLQLLLDHPQATVALAELDGDVVASGHVVLANGRAGSSGYIGGIAVVPGARRRGIGAAISSWLVDHARQKGAQLWHLHPDTDHAAGIYRRLGFVEVDGLDIYVGC